jgi:hypothetical protein
MRSYLTSALVVLLVAVALPTLPSPLAAQAPDAGGGGSPGVLLELFTSQGCSSCPPADRLLRQLAADPSLEGKIFPLSFHVDYWNYLGWQDPFSSARWSERQSRYASALNESQVYTPQLVIDGRNHVVGSKEAQVRREIERALARPVAAALTVDAQRAGDALEVEVGARRARGENGGRRLENDRVVRYLAPAATLASGATTATGKLTIPLGEDWNLEHLGVVAFLQDPRTMAVEGAAAAPVH